MVFIAGPPTFLSLATRTWRLTGSTTFESITLGFTSGKGRAFCILAKPMFAPHHRITKANYAFHKTIAEHPRIYLMFAYTDYLV